MGRKEFGKKRVQYDRNESYHKKKRMSGVAALVAAGTLFLGGCAQQNVNVDFGGDTQIGAGTMQGAESTQAGRKGLEQFQKLGKWEEKLAGKTTDGMSWTFDIDAVVKVPEGKSMPVVEVCYEEFDEEYKKRIARALFGEEVYLYGYENYTKEELEEALAQKETDLEEYKERLQYEKQNANIPEMVERLEKEIEGIEQEIKEIRQIMRGDTKENVLAKDFSGNVYWGYMDGIMYVLEFKSYGDYSNEIYLKPRNIRDICPADVKNMEYILWDSDTYSSADVENRSELTEEETEKLADGLLEKMGITSFAARKVGALSWNGCRGGGENGYLLGETWFQVTDGYHFSYGLNVDGADVTDYGMELYYTGYINSENIETYRSMQTDTWVALKGDQVVELIVYNPLHVTRITEDVKMLPLDTIQSIVRGKVDEGAQMLESLEVEKPADKVWKFNKMELICLRMRDPEKEGYYSYVPVWRLCMERTGNRCYENALLVNAIDGTWIRLWDVL